MSEPSTSSEAWLEFSDGRRIMLGASCSIGRVAGNEAVIEGDRVSRRHAMINRREAGELWLMDLGSSNGTYLNRRRILQPTKLGEGDQIEIGGHTLKFHQTPTRPQPTANFATPETLREVQSVPCWLLVADMEDSTRFVTRTSARQFAERTEHWLTQSREIVERHGGAMNKFLGDGFFAYWRQGPEVERQVARALDELRHLPHTDSPHFRLAVHFGTVVAGGGASLGEESLMGPEVHFVFRLEKLAAALGKDSIFSRAAAERLISHVSLESIGPHRLPGFEGEHECHSLTGIHPFPPPA